MPKININGNIRDMTPEEEAQYAQMTEMPKPEISPEERIAALEEELKAAKILLGLEV